MYAGLLSLIGVVFIAKPEALFGPVVDEVEYSNASTRIGGGVRDEDGVGRGMGPGGDVVDAATRASAVL